MGSHPKTSSETILSSSSKFSLPDELLKCHRLDPSLTEEPPLLGGESGLSDDADCCRP
jgi:hypothetical protein